jgi:hypothetical protein
MRRNLPAERPATEVATFLVPEQYPNLHEAGASNPTESRSSPRISFCCDCFISYALGRALKRLERLALPPVY